MFSKISGKSIAVIKSDDEQNKMLYIKEDKGDDKGIDVDFDSLDESFFKKISNRKTPNKMMSPTEIQKLKYYLTQNVAPFEDDFRDIYESKKKIIDDKSKYEITLPISQRFEIVPPMGKYREDRPEDKTTRFIIGGISGSGKSYQGSKFVEKYHTVYPKNKVYLFSTHMSDENFDKLPYIKRINIFHEDFTETPFNIGMLKNSLVIFDDVDNLQNPKLSKFIYGILNDINSNGRHQGISLIIILHQLCNYNKTKAILADISGAMLLLNGTEYTRNRFLKCYVGLDNKQQKYINKLRSEWVYIGMAAPQYVISQHKAFILNPKKPDEEEKDYLDILNA